MWEMRIVMFSPGSSRVDRAVGKLVGFDKLLQARWGEPTNVVCKAEDVDSLVALIREEFPGIEVRISGGAS